MSQQLGEQIKQKKEVFETYFVTDMKGNMWETDGSQVVAGNASNWEFFVKFTGNGYETFV